jgi:hypothetical protein
MGALTIQPDRSLTVAKSAGEETAAIEAALAAFAEPVRRTETQRTYQLTAASIWRARRHGLPLAEILRILERYSPSGIPASVRADIERWSQQIERLTLEADQGHLVLRSATPQVISAVRDHRILGTFVDRQVDTTTVALRADTYPELIQTFDAYYHLVLDRVPPGYSPGSSPVDPTSPRGRRAARRAPRHAPLGRRQPAVLQDAESPGDSAPAVRPHTGARPGSTIEVLRPLPRQCQAVTKAGRACKNRAQPASSFCWVHAEPPPGWASRDARLRQAYDAGQLLELMLEAGLVTVPQLALVRVGTLLGLGLGSWLLYALLMRVGGAWLHLSPASWAVAGLAVLLTCGLAGRLVGRLGLLSSMSIVLLLLTSLLIDCCYKDGLLLNLCFFLLPLGLPVAIVYWYGLSSWWGGLFVPLGLVLGTLVHHLLEETFR